MAQAIYLRTALIPLSDLTPFPGNAKRGDVATIVESLRRNGQYRSLVARELPGAPLVVLAGNHTAQALNKHGPGDCGRDRCGVCGNDPAWIPAARCEVVACDEDTARRVNLIDNRAADLGSYDADALAELLSFLDGDYGGTGYQEADVERLLAPPRRWRSWPTPTAPRRTRACGPSCGSPSPRRTETCSTTSAPGARTPATTPPAFGTSSTGSRPRP
ncbi:hypothetical protein ACFU8Q_32565 [Streptomyces sp. NPDC057543]|uniref:hypothetical protein n=1 Tax=Streptomyces sp. NPDC057543 TaxID=3346163 RepID=UPI003687B33A